MILPKKIQRNKRPFASELSRQEFRDLIRIERHAGPQCIEDPHTGHKTLEFVPDLEYISEKSKVPAKRIQALVKKKYLEPHFGYTTTVNAFMEVWFYLGANPLKEI